jgi:type IV secretion system protein VirB10
MGGLALGIVLVILFTGQTQPNERSAATTAPLATLPPAADRLRELDLQGQLKALEDQTRRQQAEATAAEGRTNPTAAETPAASGQPPVDPLVQERRRREYESLFASNIVASRRQPLEGTTGESRRNVTDAGAASTRLPSLDETAEAVIRASARTGQPIAMAPLGTTPSSVTTTTQAPGATPISPAGTSAAGTPARPDYTEPIDASGPLHRLLEGTVIDAVLVNRLDGSSASPVVALVAEPRYSHSGNAIVIPAGSRVLGETRPVQNFGEARLAVAFHRLIFPDGSSRSLDQFKGLNQVGDNGLHDKVNNHYLSTFGASAAVGLVSGLSQYLGYSGFGQGDNRTVVIAGGIGNETNQAATTVLNRFLNRLPTITIREGTRIKVYLTGDVELPAYTASPDARRSPGPTFR